MPLVCCSPKVCARETVFMMRHDGSPRDALRSTVGAAAGLTVHDDTGAKPVFGKSKPYDARAAVAGPLPRRVSESNLLPFDAFLPAGLFHRGPLPAGRTISLTPAPPP